MPVRVRPIAALALLAAFACPVVAGETASEPELGPPRGLLLEELARRNTPPMFAARGTMLCLGFFSRSESTTTFTWHFYPRGAELGSSPAAEPQDLSLGVAQPSGDEMVTRCGESVQLFVRLLLASCAGPNELQALLQEEETLTYRPPRAEDTVPEVSFMPAERSYWQRGDDVGCARVVTASDGSARAWTQAFERAVTDEAGQDSPRRGVAFLHWRDASGTMRVYRDGTGADLHLDAIIDGIDSWEPGARQYLVLGLRSYLTTYAGDRPRRFAQLIQLGADVTLVDGAFKIGQGVRQRLLLQAPEPGSGKFRHHALARNWLRLKGATGELVWEPVPSQHPSHGAEPRLVGRRRNGMLELAGERWGEIRVARDW